MEQKQERLEIIDALTSLRFFASLRVVVFHVTPPFFALLPVWMVPIFSSAVSVSFFFTLSGFTLGYLYLDPKKIITFSKRKFFGSRILRIYPIYLLGLFCSLPVFIKNEFFEPLAWLKAFLVAFLLQSWHPHFAYAWLAPFWALSTLICFYFAFPYVVVRMGCLSFKQCFWFLIICWLYTLLLPAFYYIFVEANLQSTILKNTWKTFIYTHPLVRFPEFVSGIALARLVRSQRNLGQYSSFSEIGFVGSILEIILILSCWRGGFDLVLSNGLLLPLNGILIYSIAMNRGWIVSALSNSYLVSLGKLSFSIYVLHGSLGSLFYNRYLPKFFSYYGMISQSSFYYLGYLCILLVCSWLITSYYEVPAAKFCERAAFLAKEYFIHSPLMEYIEQRNRRELARKQ